MFRATRLLTVLVTAMLVSLAGCGSLSPPLQGVPAARNASPAASPAYRATSYSQDDLARLWREVYGNPWGGGNWSGFAADGERGVVLKVPDIAENGAVVPVTVETVSEHGPRPRMTAVALYTCDRLRPVARYRYPRGVLQMQVRIKLRRTANVIAIATLDDGTVVRAMKQTKVTIGGCGGGGEPAPATPEVEPPSGLPEALYWQRSTLPVNTVRLSAEGDALPIESYRADVRIDGFRARVVLDIVFRNNQRWARTGKFQLRLPEGSAPYYVAFGDTVLRDEDAAPLSATLSDAVGLPDANLDFERAASNDALKE
ncbi:MAG TPA: hypothetical protein ENJ52_05075, partial [Aliiroseovarius sp.]|nr:hypothetical protein [Aliiroseovarius sp.]